MDKKREKSKKKRVKSLQPTVFARIFSHWATITALSCVLVLAIVFGTGWGYAKTYEDKIYPGVTIGNLEVGSLTAAEAKNLLQQNAEQFLKDGFEINYEETSLDLAMTAPDRVDPEIMRDLVIFDYDLMAQNALEVGRDTSFLASVHDITKAKTFGVDLPTEYQIDEDAVNRILKEKFSHYDSPAQDAQVMISFADGTSDPIFTAQEESSGTALNYEETIAEIERQLFFLEKSPIAMVMSHQEPKIIKAEAEAMIPQIKEVLGLAPINIAYSSEFQNLSWKIGPADFATWIRLKKDQDIEVAFNEEAIKTSLEEAAASIEVEPQNAVLEMEGDRVIEFSGHRDGVRIDWESTLKEFEEKIISAEESGAEIKVIIAEPEVKIGDLNDLGISELIGVGRSNFAGSPPNRRHNIRVGADMLDGLLVAPGEEFTTITKLGPVTAATGYLPELVIKENKTIPEYGGGLCQIGTTMFRVALSAGLPITERSPHAYRVVYYEPAGKDAAVYEMHPDVRFINDTGNHIMIQTHIQGDDLIFEFWGTDDGREVYESDSRIYNIVGAPATVEIPTTELPVGQRKCSEGAHAGADAEFDYKVTYPNGEVKEETFFSHYKAWGAVCHVGVEELPAEEGEGGEAPAEAPQSEGETPSVEEQEAVIPE